MWVCCAFLAGLEGTGLKAGRWQRAELGPVAEGWHGSSSFTRSQCCLFSASSSPSKSVHGVPLNGSLPACIALCLPSLAPPRGCVHSAPWAWRINFAGSSYWDPAAYPGAHGGTERNF